MTLQAWTARMGFRGLGWLDVTRKGNDRRVREGHLGGHDGIGAAFAPSKALFSYYIKLRTEADGELTDQQWAAYRKRYVSEMRTSYKRCRASWNELLGREHVVLLCFCVDPCRCHRTILASDILPKLGAKYRGEVTANNQPPGGTGET